MNNESHQRQNQEETAQQAVHEGRYELSIDDLLHPLYNVNEGFVLVDGVLHGLVEQNPPQSVKKFIKYNLPAVMKKARKLLK